ncbi:MAG: NAD(P)/FAD-dependent oxidoreductase [Dehalococcoidia bacterium]|nr:NAD(P)/FAD-dependent oxidoreductase [Dehalococcoidia bacterium]
MESYRFLILGGGMVAGYAARQLLEDGVPATDIGIVSADDVPPYERPPLSKGLLLGIDEEQDIYINPPDTYGKGGVGLHIRTTVQGLDIRAKTLAAGDQEFSYERLLVATGATPRTLDIPGSELPGVHYLRSLDDARSLRQAVDTAKRAVVIGSGFIGMEVASAFAQKDAETTLLFQGERLWDSFMTPELSAYFARYYEERGVLIRANDSPQSFAGDTKLTAVRTVSGETLEADAAVAGIGVVPVTDFLEGSGLSIDNGVVVNEYLETGAPDVWAAGDVANYQDTLFSRRRRIEHWDNAVEQGKHAARVMNGDRQPFVHVPYFFSDIFDLSYEYWGDQQGADEVIHRADWDGGSIAVFWLRRGRMVAAFVMKRPDEERDAVQRWIRESTDLSGHRPALGEPDSDIAALP